MKQLGSLGGIALALALAATGAPALAQHGLMPTPNPLADQLAQELRVVAADPRNVRALLAAGNLSAKLGDTAAALAFFARAETVDASNPGILAGRGAALVRMERPGEALRLFQAAEARGLNAREYAADRGFAYDLLGQPVLAQADYKRALQDDRDDDETVRRYALSLGITGNVEESMRQLDPLLRKSDRAAWRARAFVLAMNGDMPGAERIAASMMPGNMGSSLAPFFRRLANLAPADRAFAVHFGQISPTAARLADARLAPVLPRYVPARPVQVAQAQPTRTPAAEAPKGRDRRTRRQRERDERQVAPPARRPAPVETAAYTPPPLPAAPPQVVMRETAPIVQPLPKPRSEELDTPPVRDVPARETAAPVQTASREPAPQPSAITPPGQGTPAATSVGDTARTTAAAATLPAAARPDPQPTTVANAPEPAPPGPARVGQEDSVLAAIVAGITIPAEELQVVTAAPVDPVPEPTRVVAAAPETPRASPKPETPKPAAKPKPEPVKPDPKAKDPKKPDPKAKKPEPKPKLPAEPARVWVQVAGGANEGSLPKAWKAVVAKAPAAFKGKSGWWTPLRATNRVLAGPFKTASEAQAFVNTLRKADVSGFVFTSEAGQKVTKLSAN